MDNAHWSIIRGSLILWVGSVLMVSLTSAAAVLGDADLLFLVLGLTGAFALFGIGFGLWVGRRVARIYRRPS